MTRKDGKGFDSLNKLTYNLYAEMKNLKLMKISFVTYNDKEVFLVGLGVGGG